MTDYKRLTYHSRLGLTNRRGTEQEVIDRLAELEDKIESGELGDIKELSAENERLRTELQHREEDLIHADEKVFYRETAVKLDEDKIKQQAVKEFVEKLKINITKRLKDNIGMKFSQSTVQSFHDKAQRAVDELVKEY